MYGNIPDQGITVKVPNPPKAARLRLPTTDEMLGRLAQQKSIRRSIGRRKTQTQFIPNPQADLALFNQIRLDKDGPEFDEFEASTAVSRLTFCEVTDCERVGEEYRITLHTPLGDTTHTMRIPTQRDLTLYRRSVVSSTDLPHGQEEIRYRTEPAIDLYDSVVAQIDGYAGGIKAADVPPHHKSSVVVELVQAIDDLDPQLDPNS